MFKIIGADNQVYGPVTVEVLRQWIAEGRVNGETRVQAEGSPEWKPLASFPELAALLGPMAGATAPPATPGAGGWTATPGSGATGPMPRPSGDTESARAAVRVPAILLIIAGALGIFGGLLSLAQHFIGSGMMPLPPDVPPELARALRMMSSVPWTMVGLVTSTVILLGAISMLHLQRWGLAVAACCLGLVCGNPCCCPLGLVAGIWGLVQLFNETVKAAFH